MREAGSRAPVTVIGLGRMGRALAEAFIAGGHPTVVWNRSGDKAKDLVTRGASHAVSISDAVAASNLVVVCVLDHQTVHELVDPVADVLRGRVLANLTTSTAEQARQTAEWAVRHGVTYLDGVILAVPRTIGTADAAVLYSGPKATFDLHRPTLRRLGAGTEYLGPDHGLSALYDMAILGMMWNSLNGYLQAAALLETAAVSAPSSASLLLRTTVALVTDMISTYAGQIDTGAYPAEDATLDAHRAAMAALRQECEAVGIATELPRFVELLAARAIATGHGGDSYAALIRQFRSPAPTG